MAICERIEKRLHIGCSRKNTAGSPALRQIPGSRVLAARIRNVAPHKPVSFWHGIRKARIGEFERQEKPLVKQITIFFTGNLFDDQTEQNIAGIAVFPSSFFAGRKTGLTIIDGVLD